MANKRATWVISETPSTSSQPLRAMNQRTLGTVVGELAVKRHCTAEVIFLCAIEHAGGHHRARTTAFGDLYESLKAGNNIVIPPFVQEYCDRTWDERITCAKCNKSFDHPVHFSIQGANGSGLTCFCSFECHQAVSSHDLSPKLALLLGTPATKKDKGEPVSTTSNGSTGPPTDAERTTPIKPVETTDEENEMSRLNETRRTAEAAVAAAPPPTPQVGHSLLNNTPSVT